MQANGEWTAIFQDAVQESDPMLAEVKIRMAEDVIFNKIHDYSESRDCLEEKALLDALGTIRVFKSLRRFSKVANAASCEDAVRFTNCGAAFPL